MDATTKPNDLDPASFGSSAPSRTEMLGWFAKHPSMYRELSRMTRNRIARALGIQPDRDIEAARGAAACAEWCIPTEEAYRRLGLTEGMSLAERYPDEWREAERRTAAVPVAMGGAANFELLYDLVRSLRPDRVLETGVALGWSSLAILLALESLGHGELVSIDMPYPGMKNDAFVGIAVPPRLHSRWTLIRRPDRDVLRSTVRRLGSIDLAHYDSDKSRPGRAFAYPTLWRALRPNGVLVSDDIADNPVFDEFARQVERDPIVIRKDVDNCLGILVKPGE
jgi:predicted O-methyltransferase YrrM